MQSSAPYVTVESSHARSHDRASCVGSRSMSGSDLASHKQTRGVLCYLTLPSIRIFLVMTDLPLCVRNEKDRQKIY
jgi:hypothetical protein